MQNHYGAQHDWLIQLNSHSFSRSFWCFCPVMVRV